MLVFAGVPWEYNNKLYNTAAAIQDGGVARPYSQNCLPNYSEFCELRYFNPGFEKPVAVPWEDGYVLMGSKILFNCANVENPVVGAEICEDVWVLNPPVSAMLRPEPR